MTGNPVTDVISSGSVILSNSTAMLDSFTITNATLIFTNWTTVLQATNRIPRKVFQYRA